MLAIDFDGVIHAYSQGWQGGKIYDVVTPGFFAWAEAAARIFELVVYSSRSASPEGVEAMRAWFARQALEHYGPDVVTPFDVTFSATKPPAWLTIDDRCVRFDGSWSAADLQPEAMRAYRSWVTRG